jgi:putative ribosome biogenesis GTPase RsgA
MSTQQVRAADGRGRHTTVHRELIPLPGGGLVIDTPGIRRIGLYDIGEGVDLVFSDIEALAERCRFGDCGHSGEPGCAVLAALESGELPERRLVSWRKLQREAAWMASTRRCAAQTATARNPRLTGQPRRPPGHPPRRPVEWRVVRRRGVRVSG